MGRRLLVLLGVIFLFSVSARAQREVEIYAGYSYEGLYQMPNAIPGRNLNGAEIAAQYKLTSWFGAVAEVDGHFGLPANRDARILGVMGGAQVSLPRRRRISPFAHALVGVGHARTDGIWDTSLAEAFGGGVDLRIAPLLSWRTIQVDDVRTGYFGGSQQNVRISTGILWRF
jgi:hypothetical protein